MPAKITPALMQSIIEEETKKLFGDTETTADRAKETEEVDADEIAQHLSNKIDYVKALKIEEARLTSRLEHINSIKRTFKKQFGI